MDLDVETRLRAHLVDQADELRLEGAGADVAMERGRRMANRRYALMTAAGVLFVIAGVAGVLGLGRLFADDPGSGDEAEPGADAAADAAAPVALEWYAVEGTVGFSRRITTGSDGMVYALSTAPGRNAGFDAPAALYSSADGESWDVAVLADDVYASDLAVGGDALYVIGTAPGFAAVDPDVPEVVVSASDDGAGTWTASRLPVAAMPPSEVGAVRSMFSSTWIAANDSAVVAAVQTNYDVDLRSLVPADVLGPNTEVIATEEGVDVVDYGLLEIERREGELGNCVEDIGPDGSVSVRCEGVAVEGVSPTTTAVEPADPSGPVATTVGVVEDGVVASFTWEELGLNGAQQTAFSELFVSADGDAFEAVDSPFAAGGSLMYFEAAGGEFFAVEGGFDGVPVFWRSVDGRSWQQMTPPAGLQYVVDVGAMGDDLVVVGWNQMQRPVVAWDDGVGSWTEADLTGVLPGVQGIGADVGESWISAGSVGPLGVVLGVQMFTGQAEASVVLYGTSPQSWEAVPLDALLQGGSSYIDHAVVTADRILVGIGTFTNGGAAGRLELVGAPAE